MKKIVLTLLSIVFSVTLMGQTTFTKDGLSYTVIGGNNVSVKKTQEIVNLVIPSQVENGNTTYTVTEIEENGFFQTNNLRTVSILASVTIGNSAFGNCGNLLEVEGENVTSIGNSAFQGCSSLQSILLPSVTSIGNSAFQSCGNLLEVDMGENVTSIGTSAFKECRKLQSILIPSGVTTIADNCFEACERLNEIIISANVTSIGASAFQNVQTIGELIFMGCGDDGNITIGANAFQNCNNVHVEVLCPNGLKFNDSYQNVFGNNPEIHTPCGSASNYVNAGWNVNQVNPGGGCVSTTRQSGYFCFPETWKGYENWITTNADYPEDGTYADKEAWLKNNNDDPADDRYPDFVPRKPDHPFHIVSGHTVTLTHVHHIYPYNSINEGVIRLEGNGQLIERDADDNLGLVYMHENLGGVIEIVVPTTENRWHFVGAPFAGYTLGAVKPVSGSDVAMVKYDYTQGKWSDAWATYDTPMEAGEGIFAWPFYGGEITFSTYNFGESTDSQYPPDATADYALNNGDVTVTKTITASSGGNWMALSNPYPAKLSLSKFLNDNALAELTVGDIQGEGVYLFNGTSFDYTNSGDILMTEGFFVNFASPSENADDKRSVVFKKSQLKDYPTTAKGAKSSANEFIELTLQNGNDKVRVYLAQNEDAEQGYDILDANKMFATTGVAEPYFVTDGIALIKEEVRDLPYYATMNVRSQQDTVMNFVLTNLPEGYAVSIIDGEEVIDMVEGGVYSTEISSGENADRFKVLVKKNVGLADVEELDVRIINSNRHITITAQEDVKVTVYNTLGQRVFETEKTDFVLSGVASGAYVVKVQGAKAAKSQKIIVE